MSDREQLLITLLKLAREEIECLRSVVSEWDTDKTCYIQFNRAEILKEARETLEFKI